MHGRKDNRDNEKESNHEGHLMFVLGSFFFLLGLYLVVGRVEMD